MDLTKPYKVIDLMTDQYLGSYNTYDEAQLAHRNDPVTIIYRPGKRKAKRRVFP